MRNTDVFTPSDYPVHTYVQRDERKTEERLRQALETPGEVVSVSGPSKSGKTVLIEKVAGRENLITVTGASIHEADHLWEKALDWMDVPNQTTKAASSTNSINPALEVAAKAGNGVIGEVGAKFSLGGSKGGAATETISVARRGMTQVIREIADSPFVLLIDDFHYMPAAVQGEVARQIKEAARLGVKICTASVPHRSDDVVRANPELRGRIRAVDTQPWAKAELSEIGRIGFPILGINIPAEKLDRLAAESSQSPQLMQAICLQVSYTIGLRDSTDSLIDRDLTDDEIIASLEETSTRTDFSSLVRQMHEGPKTRGTERKEFNLSDGSRGDVYRALLLALKADPPSSVFQWNNLSRRMQLVCSPDSPQAASLSTACAQIARIAKDMYPGQRVLDWDGDPANLLSVEDPYFLFYLRWSDRLKSLGRK